MPFFAASEAPPRPESMKFPVFSLLAGNLAFSETSSQLDSPSSGESCANLVPRSGAWLLGAAGLAVCRARAARVLPANWRVRAILPEQRTDSLPGLLELR